MNQDKQPEALRLANWLDTGGWPSYVPQESSEELRRQHARIAELEAQLATVQQGVQQTYVLEDDGHETYLDGCESRFSIRRADGECVAWVTPLDKDSGEAVAREMISALNATHPTQQGLDAREFPAMTPELASILGLMCFQCISFAQALRAGGQQINTRAEDEQAAVLHWMLGHYFRHGEAWRAAAAEDVERMKAAALAAQAKQGEQP